MFDDEKIQRNSRKIPKYHAGNLELSLLNILRFFGEFPLKNIERLGKNSDRN